MPNNTAIRQDLRARRRQLPSDKRYEYDKQINATLSGSAIFTSARRVAAFCAFDGEVDLQQAFHACWQAGKDLYLPAIIANGKPLQFVPYAQEDKLVRAEFGILRPDRARQEWANPEALDLVLTPMVAFNQKGYRLGVGGGFYDRSFAFLKNHSSTPPTKLLGVAYSFQQDNAFSVHDWDVPLHAVVTELGLQPF